MGKKRLQTYQLNLILKERDLAFLNYRNISDLNWVEKDSDMSHKIPGLLTNHKCKA